MPARHCAEARGGGEPLSEPDLGHVPVRSRARDRDVPGLRCVTLEISRPVRLAMPLHWQLPAMIR